MRISLGMEVEAWIPEAATNMGSWRAGKVLWGNGHSYVMKWLDGGPESARIPRKFIRPIPKPNVDMPMPRSPTSPMPSPTSSTSSSCSAASSSGRSPAPVPPAEAGVNSLKERLMALRSGPDHSLNGPLWMGAMEDHDP